MKLRNLVVLPTAVMLVATFATSRWLAAQVQTEEHSKKEHRHYKLVDLCTLGGPHSYGSVNGDGFQLLNNSGVVASYADTGALRFFYHVQIQEPLDCRIERARAHPKLFSEIRETVCIMA